jgi:hypothetical protein
VSEKHDAFIQVRVPPDLVREIMDLIAGCGYSVTFTSFAQDLLRKGAVEERKFQKRIKK